MKRRRQALRFLLDEGVTVAVGEMLQKAGHEVIYFNESGLEKGAADQMVCIAAALNEAVLVAHDNDMKTLARGHGITPARFKTLSLLKLACRESVAAERTKLALSLIEHEWQKGKGQERRLYVVLGDTVIKSYR